MNFVDKIVNGCDALQQQQQQQQRLFYNRYHDNYLFPFLHCEKKYIKYSTIYAALNDIEYVKDYASGKMVSRREYEFKDTRYNEICYIKSKNGKRITYADRDRDLKDMAISHAIHEKGFYAHLFKYTLENMLNVKHRVVIIMPDDKQTCAISDFLKPFNKKNKFRMVTITADDVKVQENDVHGIWSLCYSASLRHWTIGLSSPSSPDPVLYRQLAMK